MSHLEDEMRFSRNKWIGNQQPIFCAVPLLFTSCSSQFRHKHGEFYEALHRERFLTFVSSCFIWEITLLLLSYVKPVERFIPKQYYTYILYNY